ncbi:MAG: helix-turn-helix domain-containing protein [Planctomycetia bacterium]|nr:helix-turn-helix domain-containing protein [Planctomycetia bacterium]
MEPAKYSTYDVRIRAVKAILAGQRKIDVAKAYQIDYATLCKWCKRHNNSENFSGGASVITTVKIFLVYSANLVAAVLIY